MSAERGIADKIIRAPQRGSTLRIVSAFSASRRLKRISQPTNRR
jgi:hypothetical protein